MDPALCAAAVAGGWGAGATGRGGGAAGAFDGEIAPNIRVNSLAPAELDPTGDEPGRVVGGKPEAATGGGGADGDPNELLNGGGESNDALSGGGPPSEPPKEGGPPGEAPKDGAGGPAKAGGLTGDPGDMLGRGS